MSVKYPLEYQGFSIVVIGSFNPTIFQPLWFSANNLMSFEEASTSTNVQIIHRSATVFSTDWFSLQVTLERFQLDTSDPAKAKPLRDLAAGTFSILEHTPLSRFGYNWWGHFRMPSSEKWHAFGHHFAPKESWHPILKEPGMRNLVMQGKAEGRDSTINVALEPSAKVEHGVFISVNEEYDVSTGQDRPIAFFLESLQESWDSFIQFGHEVSSHLLSSYSRHSKKKRA